MIRRGPNSGEHKSPSVRVAQVASAIGRAVQMEIQRGIADPRVRGMVTVLGTDVTPDLDDVTVRVSVLPGEYGPLTVQALNHAVPHFRKALNEEVRMRRLPRLRFQLDETLKKAAAVDLAIRQAAEGQEPAASGTDSDTDSESAREE